MAILEVEESLQNIEARKPCRVGNVFLLPTTFLMRKVGNKRTLPTLHLLF